MIKSELDYIVDNYKYLYGQQGNWRSYWQDVFDFVLPRKAWVTTVKITGDQLKYNFLYDSRAILALKKSAAGFHSNLTNPSSLWFAMATLEDKYMQSGAVQRYFKECTDIQYAIMNNSNFNNAAMEFYTDILSAGTATILTEASDKSKVRYTSIPIEQTLIEEDAEGFVCAFYRPMKLTAIQIKMKWPSCTSKDVVKAIEDGKPYQKFDVLHHVSRRDRRDYTKLDSVNMEWKSCWILVDDRYELGESGFVENPYSVARWWKHNDDCYGYSPAMDVLASVKLVNAQKRTVLRSAMKQADPATMMPYKYFIQPMNLNPAAMNYYDASKFKADQFQPIRNEGNIPINVEIMQMEQALIDEGFYVNLFQNLMNVTKQMTVPEVQKRVAEALALVSPVIGHVLDEGFTPLLLRTFGVLDRQLLFPPPPKEIQGSEMDINYLSPLAKAQRSAEMNGMAAWTEYIMGMSERGLPDIKDKVDSDFVADYSAELLGVNPKALKDQRQVDAIRAQNKQMQSKMLQLQMAEQAAKVAETGSRAKKNAQESEQPQK